MSDLAVAGSPQEQASTERIAWTFDWTERLGGQTISSASATATQIDTGASVTATVISGSVVTTTTTTTVSVISLTAHKRYRIAVTAVFSGGSHQTAELVLEAPF